jgi:hypothetical protein
MKAVETTGHVDKDGNLHLSKPLDAKNQDVRLIVLFSENETEDEKLWISASSKNPAFSFLEDPAEDIYKLKDGRPFHD